MGEAVIYFLTGLVLAGVALLVLNAIYIRTPYYQNQVRPIKKFQDGVPDNLDIMNTGSNHAFFSIDWSIVGINGFSLASGPQTISWDHRLVKKYVSKINRGGVLLIVISPLHLGFLEYPNDSSNRRYYFFMKKNEIPNYTLWKKIKYTYFPILESWRNIIHCFYHRGTLVTDRTASLEYAEEQMNQRIEGWKKQFMLNDLQHQKSLAHLQVNIRRAGQVLSDIVSYARINDIHPIILIPPFSSVINKKISDEFLQAIIYTPVKSIVKRVPVLDYIRDERFQDYRLYQNGDFMNAEGRKVFMPVLWHDIQSCIGKKTYE